MLIIARNKAHVFVYTLDRKLKRMKFKHITIYSICVTAFSH